MRILKELVKATDMTPAEALKILEEAAAASNTLDYLRTTPTYRWLKRRATRAA